MRRLIILITAIGLVGLLVVIATSSGSTKAQIPPPPTPKGQLGGSVRLNTPPVLPPPFATTTPTTSSIVGSWLVTVSPISMPPAATPAAVVPPMLLTFAADGTLTGAAGNSNGASIHGAWSASQSGNISLHALWLTFAPNGTYASTVELTGTVHLEAGGNRWDGEFMEQELRPHGRLYGLLKVDGVRITVQPGPLNPPYAATVAP